MESKTSSFSNNKIDYKELIQPYLKHWRWFVFSLIVSITIAIIYLRYATPLYEARAKIQIIDLEHFPLIQRELVWVLL